MTAIKLRKTIDHLSRAVLQTKAYSHRGFQERLFTLLFSSLVYSQIWEDPEVDMEALALGETSRLVAITSGGCNVLSYLVANPARIIAVDLNSAHVALARLKLVALRHLPNHDAFFRFFGVANDSANVAAYRQFIGYHLDAESRAYWEGRDFLLRQRISVFGRNLYRHGLFGRFIGFGHWLARLHGVDPKHLTRARNVAEQSAFFDTAMAPLFDVPAIKWALSKSPALFGLGIPPAQYDVLAAAGAGDMGAVVKQRLRSLACSYPLKENYFTWQAFGRAYGGGADGPLPPYLQRRNFETLRGRTDRVTVVQRSITEQLAMEEGGSVDGYVLLDAQDWMSDAQLNALWSEITRTARPNSKVIFRTAAAPTMLPGRVAAEILARWTYEEEASLRLGAKDRAATYGGFHLYVSKG